MFNENEISLKAAVISDLHLLYTYHTGEDVKKNIQKYASFMNDLRNMADDDLDIVMMCGDYVSLGCLEQAESFAQSTRAICDGIFKNKKMPSLLIGMGNHDTCWRNQYYQCMNAAEWYKLFDKYGLDDGFAEDSDKELGNIHIKVSKNGKAHHFLYIETESYAENIFKPETYKWLDEMLSKITAENPNDFVFIGTHGPVAESGIYGADVTLEAGAVWATAKNNIHNILAKYPQVVIFSGHTHFTAELETTIMQKEYTAVNVPAAFARDFYNASYAKFLDGVYPDEQYGMGYYIEVDTSGNVRIKKLNFLCGGVEVEAEAHSVDNPAYGKYKDETEKMCTVTVKKCEAVTNEKTTTFGDDWILEHPEKDGSHLKKYSPARGNVKPPEFKSIDDFKVKKSGSGSLCISFPAAVSERIILYYIINLYDGDGEKCAEHKVLGNWCKIKNGVAEGKLHTDASRFEYEIPDTEQGGGSMGFVAVDEYGNRSEEIKINEWE